MENLLKKIPEKKRSERSSSGESSTSPDAKKKRRAGTLTSLKESKNTRPRTKSLLL